MRGRHHLPGPPGRHRVLHVVRTSPRQPVARFETDVTGRRLRETPGHMTNGKNPRPEIWPKTPRNRLGATDMDSGGVTRFSGTGCEKPMRCVRLRGLKLSLPAVQQAPASTRCIAAIAILSINHPAPAGNRKPVPCFRPACGVATAPGHLRNQDSIPKNFPSV